RLPLTATEVAVKLKRPPVTHLPAGEGNYFRFELSPEVRIVLGIRLKKPGEVLASEPSELSFLHCPTRDELGDYERLLGDAMVGDPILFARQDAVEAAWKIVEPVLGNVTPVEMYDPGTWGPASAGKLAEPVGGWTAVTSGR